MSIVLGPYLFVCLIGWWDRDSFWGPNFSFFEQVLVCMLFVLGGRLWDLQHIAEMAEERTNGLAEKLEQRTNGLAETLADLQQELDLKQGTLADRLLQIKGVSLDITEQLSAVERKIDLMGRQM